MAFGVSGVAYAQRPAFGPPRFEVTLKEVLIATVQKVTKSYLEKKALLEQGSKLEGIIYPQDAYYHYERYDKQIAERMLQQGDCLHGQVDSTYFHHTESREFATGLIPYNFVILPGKRPSEALDAIEQGPSFIDCGCVIELGCYRALQCVLGISKFDGVFSGEGETPLTFGLNGSFDPLRTFHPLHALVTVLFPRSESEIELGDLCSHQNHPLYQIKNPYGYNASCNTVCRGKKDDINSYVGFGFDPEGVSSQDINTLFFDACQKDRADILVSEEIHYSMFPKNTSPSSSERLNTCDRESFIQHPKVGLKLLTLRLDPKKIALLIKSSVKEGRELLQHWRRESIKQIK